MGRPRQIVVAGLALATALLYYATVVEPSRLEVTEITVRDGRLARLLDGRTVAFLSDLHFGDADEPAADKALGVLGAARPDLILLGGDYVRWRAGAAAYRRALDFLSRLDAPLGVYAILGDADRTSSRDSCLFCHEAGTGAPTGRHRVHFLQNSSASVDVAGEALLIVGLDPDCSTSPGPAIRQVLSSAAPKILLSHSSTIYRQLDPAAEVLTLSGDTHGGQVLLPERFWRLSRSKPDPAHISGYFRDGVKSLFVSRGVGTSHARFRLGAPPEVAIFRFAGGTR